MKSSKTVSYSNSANSSQHLVKGTVQLPKIVKFYGRRNYYQTPFSSLDNKLSIIKSFGDSNNENEIDGFNNISKINRQNEQKIIHNNNKIVKLEKKKDANGKYYKLSSFEEKLKKELQRVSKKYTTNDSRILFSPSNISNLYWNKALDYKNYRDIKEMEDRIQRPKNLNKKPRWKPLVSTQKNNVEKLAERIFNTEKNIVKIDSLF